MIQKPSGSKETVPEIHISVEIQLCRLLGSEYGGCSDFGVAIIWIIAVNRSAKQIVSEDPLGWPHASIENQRTQCWQF